VSNRLAPANTASLTMAVGPLVGPVLGRVVGMMAARAQCPLDRLDDALLVTDALAAHGAAHVVAGHLGVAITADPRSLDLEVGPLRAGGASAVLAAAVLPGVGNVIERVAAEVRTTEDSEGERLLVRVAL